MRTSRSLALLTVVTPALVALPVMTPARPAPRPVAPTVTRVALAGVDAGAAAATGAPAGVGPADIRTTPGSGRRTVTLTRAQGTRTFSTVGITWQRDAATGPVQAWVRTRSQGAWSDWSSLGGQDDAASDSPSAGGTSVRAGTAPFWTGAADGVQVRVDVLSGSAPRDLRLELVDPGTSAADATAAAGGAPRSSASAEAGFPGVRTRADWGADESLRKCPPEYSSSLKAASVHHTNSGNGYSAASVPSIIRGIYAYHVQSLGWCDIGYNFLVDAYGTAWEGRYGGMDKTVIGAHTMGFNTGTVGIAMLGTFLSVTPPAPALATVARVAAWKLGAANRDPQATVQLVSEGNPSYPPGTVVTAYTVFAHRDVYPTEDPGTAGYATMPSIRSQARAAIGAGFVNPTVTETATGIRVTAGALVTPMGWTLDVLQASTGLRVRRFAYAVTNGVDATWDRLSEGGLPLPDGDYRLVLTGSSGSSVASPWSQTVKVTGGVVTSAGWGLLGGTYGRPSGSEIVARGAAGQILSRQVVGSTPTPATDLGGVLVGAPTAAWRSGTVLNVFARGRDNAIYTNGRVNGQWSGWSSMGGIITARPAAASSPYSLNLAVRGTDGAIWHAYSNAPGSWAAWQSMGGTFLPGAGPAAAWTPAERFDIYAVGNDQQIYRRSWTGARGWTWWQPLGGATSEDISAAAPGSDETVVALRGADGSISVRTVRADGTGSWTNLGGVLVSPPTVTAVPGSGTVQLVAVGRDGALYRQIRTGTVWSGWQRLG